MNEGHPGWVTDYSRITTHPTWDSGTSDQGLIQHIDAWQSAAQPDIVILFIGINDLSSFGISSQDCATAQGALIDKMKANNPGVIVYVGLHSADNPQLNPFLISVISSRPDYNTSVFLVDFTTAIQTTTNYDAWGAFLADQIQAHTPIQARPDPAVSSTPIVLRGGAQSALLAIQDTGVSGGSLASDLTITNSIDVQAATILDGYGAGGGLHLTGDMSSSTGADAITIVSGNNPGGVVSYAGTNTYAGATVVNSGMLWLHSGSEMSPITVASGACLEFTLGSTITSSGSLTLGAGSTIRINGTPALSSYTLMTASGISGTPVLATPVTGYVLTALDGSLILAVAPPAAVAPSITVQPVSQTVMSGQGATFTVVVMGTPAPTYQWLSAPSGGGFSSISGATSASCVISTTSVAQSGTRYEVIVTNGAGSVTSTVVTLTVTPAAMLPVIASALSMNGVVGIAFNYQITATNGATSYQASGLPPGLTLDPAIGTISGIPSAAGPSTVGISAANAAGQGAPSILSITIAPPSALHPLQPAAVVENRGCGLGAGFAVWSLALSTFAVLTVRRRLPRS